MEKETKNEQNVTIANNSDKIKAKEKIILKSLDGLSAEQVQINRDLVRNIAFMSVTLEDLANDIAINGVKEKYMNGANQYGYKDRTEVKTYNNMFKNYQSSLKQLNDLVGKKITFEDEFDEFENKY